MTFSLSNIPNNDVEKSVDVTLAIAKEKPLLIGRYPNCDINSSLFFKEIDSKISRSHAVIKWVKSHLEIEDVGSSNGTFVNAYRLEKNEPIQLRSGDIIVVGSLMIKIKYSYINNKSDLSHKKTIPIRPRK